MGRPYLGAGEIRRMIYAENIIRFYKSKTNSANWVEWAQAHPGPDAILNEAMKLAENYGD